MATNPTAYARPMPASDTGRLVAAWSYLERSPVPGLRDLVRTVWVQRVAGLPCVQRNLPTGGVELHCPIGGIPLLIGPLTMPSVDVYPPGRVVVGVRFLPGVVPSMFGVPAAPLVDLAVPLDALWGDVAVVLAEQLANAPTPDAALGLLQECFVRNRAKFGHPDPLVRDAARQLLPWRRIDTGALSADLAISASQLRRRFLESVGVGPKALQRTLRFQGFLALVQSAARTDSRGDRIAQLAADLGYADHAHLARECMRLAGITPGEFVDKATGHCRCGHDHTASYMPILRGRPRPRVAG